MGSPASETWGICDLPIADCRFRGGWRIANFAHSRPVPSPTGTNHQAQRCADKVGATLGGLMKRKTNAESVESYRGNDRLKSRHTNLWAAA